MSVFDDLYAAIDDEPRFWTPEPGDTIAGTVLMITETPTRFGMASIASLGTAGGRTDVWLTHADLRRRWQAHEVEAGDAVAIRRLEDARTNAGYRCKRYRLVVRKGGVA